MTKKYEAHVWDSRQIFLGSYAYEEQAAMAVDLAALKIHGPRWSALNFPLSMYRNEVDQMGDMSLDDIIGMVRQQAKAGNKLVQWSEGAGAGATMEAWELDLSACIYRDVVILGMYGSEKEAIQALSNAEA